MSTNPVIVMPKVWSDVDTPPLRERLWIEAGKACYWCKKPTRYSKDQAWDSTTIDHVMPRYKGGTSDPSNLVAACQRCNNRRSNEDARGLPEGTLLGKWKENETTPTGIVKKKSKYVALTADDKKRIMANGSVTVKASAYQVHTEQRDQALKEIQNLRDRISVLESDVHLGRVLVNDKDATIADLTARMESMTVLYLIRKKLAAWLLR